MLTMDNHPPGDFYVGEIDLPVSDSSSMQRERSSHNPSKNLSGNEIQCLYDLLGNDCVTLATAVTQILHGSRNVWKKQACGVLCYVKDYRRRSFCFRLYNLKTKQSIYEEITPITLLFLDKVVDLFYTFDGSKCKVGINFVDPIEAETFSKLFYKKQADRRRKMQLKQSKTLAVPTLTNGIKPSAATPAPAANNRTLSKKSKDKKKDLRQLVISEPVRTSFQHLIHVGQDSSFLTDTTKKELFDEVLDSMLISPEEKSYIRKAISNADDGLDKLFTKPLRDPNTQGKSTMNPPPIPPQRSPTANFNPPQLINSSHPSNDFSTSKGSMPPPRPPPLPPKLQNSSALAPPPPPPLSSLPVAPFKPKENLNVPSASSSNTNRTSFLDGICGFDKDKLKSVPQQAPPPIKSSENSGKPDARNTLEENIRILLDSRRVNIMGGDKHEESDSNGDDWDA